MTIQIRNNTPRSIPLGIRDLSVPPPVREPISSAIHAPLLYLFTEKGTDDQPFMVTPGTLENLIGTATFDRRGIYYYHQTAVAEACLNAGNAIEVQRLRPVYAKNATKVLALSVEEVVIADGGDWAEYERNPDDTVVFDDEVGVNQRVETPLTASGAVVRWGWFDRTDFIDTDPLNPIDFANDPSLDPNDFEIQGATVTGPNGETYRPILDFKANEFGAAGNDIGIRVWVAHESTNNPASSTTIETNRALVLNAVIFRRPGTGATGVPVTDLNEETIIEFSFPIGAYDTQNNLDLSVENFFNNFNDDGSSTNQTPVFGPLAPVQFYADNYLDLARIAATAEQAASTALGRPQRPNLTDTPFLVDLLTGIDLDTGTPYAGIQLFQDYTIVNPVDVAAGLYPNLTENGTTSYLTLGSDGSFDPITREWQVPFINLGITDELGRDVAVGANAMASFLLRQTYMPAVVNNPSSPLRDMAKYPFSAIYDSGFEFETKYAMMPWLGIRPDIHLTLSTFVEGDPELSIAEEISVAATLTSRVRLFPESVYHGTGTVRNSIWAQSGEFINGRYRFNVSTSTEIAGKRAAYLGAGSGIPNAGRGYESGANATVETLKNLTAGNISVANRESLWLGGANFAVPLDRVAYHWPAMQTTYPEDRSVLTSELISWVYGDLQRVAFRVWQQLSGNVRLTTEQLAERSNTLILEEVNRKGSYDGLVIVTPRTFRTPADQNREFSWSTEIEVYSNVMDTTNRITIEAHRLSDLNT